MSSASTPTGCGPPSPETPEAVFRRRRGEVRVNLGRAEGELLRELVHQYVSLLESGGDPADPVHARLFPSASFEDERLAAEYRRLAAADLDSHKRATAEVALRCLEGEGGWRGALSEEEREAWLVLLTDLRLALGVRIGVTEETYQVAPDPKDDNHWPLMVLHYLGALQESLVEACERT